MKKYTLIKQFIAKTASGEYDQDGNFSQSKIVFQTIYPKQFETIDEAKFTKYQDILKIQNNNNFPLNDYDYEIIEQEEKDFKKLLKNNKKDNF